MRVSKNYSGEFRKMVKSVLVLNNGRIRASTGKRWNRCVHRKTLRVSTEKGSNQFEYQKIEESEWVPRKSRIRASIEKLLRWLPEKSPISVSTEKWSNSCEYREKEESLRVSKNCSGEYRKRVQSMRVPKNGRIRVSTRKSRIRTSIEKLFGWVLEKGPINVSTEKKKNPGEYQEKVESVRVSKNSTDEYRKVSNQCE